MPQKRKLQVKKQKQAKMQALTDSPVLPHLSSENLTALVSAHILPHMASYIKDWRNLVALSMTNKTMSEALKADEAGVAKTLWEPYFEVRWPGLAINPGSTYKRSYKDNYNACKAAIRNHTPLDATQPILTSDREYVLLKADEQVSRNSMSPVNYFFQYLSPAFRVDKEIILTALTRVNAALTPDPFIAQILRFAPPALLSDEEVISERYRKYPQRLLQSLPTGYNSMKDKMLPLIKKGHDLYRHLSDELKEDSEIIITAMRHHPFIPLLDSSKADDNLMRTLIRINPSCFKHASDTLKNDSAFVLPLIRKHPELFRHASAEIRGISEVAFQAAIKRLYNFDFISAALKGDNTFILKLISADGRQFKSLPFQFRDDKNIVLLAVKTNKRAFFDASDRLKTDSAFFDEVLKVQPAVYLTAACKSELEKDRARLSALLEQSCHTDHSYNRKGQR